MANNADKKPMMITSHSGKYVRHSTTTMFAHSSSTHLQHVLLFAHAAAAAACAHALML